MAPCPVAAFCGALLSFAGTPRCDVWGVVWISTWYMGYVLGTHIGISASFSESMVPLSLSRSSSPPPSSFPPPLPLFSLLGFCSFLVHLLQSPGAGTDVYACGSWASDRLSVADWYLTWDVLFPYGCCNVTRDLAAEIGSLLGLVCSAYCRLRLPSQIFWYFSRRLVY